MSLSSQRQLGLRWVVLAIGARLGAAQHDAGVPRMQYGAMGPRMDSDNDGFISQSELDSWAAFARAPSTPGGQAGGAVAPNLASGTPEVLCKMLMQLEDSCAYDLSEVDPGATPGTLVRDFCPEECEGRAHCATPALEFPFLSAASLGGVVDGGEDSTVTLEGTACVDDGGARFDGDAGISVSAPLSAYGTSGAFTLSFWLPKDHGLSSLDKDTIWNGARGGDSALHPPGGVAHETIFAHGTYDAVARADDPWPSH